MTGQIPGLHDLARIVGEHRRLPQRGRLVLEHGQGIPEALRPYTARPEFVPHPSINAGTGLTYQQIELHHVPDLLPGQWRLLEDGEVISSGTLGIPPEN